MTSSTEQERAEFERERVRKFKPEGPFKEALARDEQGSYIDSMTIAMWDLWQAARRAPAEPVISEAQVLAITTAYEQGVGKGHQSHAHKEAITNPYGDEWGCDSAWQMGYGEGREQAERKKAAAPDLLEAQLSAIGAGGVEPLRKQVAAPQAVHPENIREGAPYDNPEFEQLARAMGIWGTPQAALCAQFWLAATHPTQQGLDAAARELIDRLQDAQQDINLAANTHMSQQLASAAALLDEVESTLRALSATQPAAQGMDSAISESVLEAVKAINRGNGDGRAYRAALGWIVAHLNQAVARSLAVDPSGKVALPLATALAAQAKQGGAA